MADLDELNRTAAQGADWVDRLAHELANAIGYSTRFALISAALRKAERRGAERDRGEEVLEMSAASPDKCELYPDFGDPVQLLNMRDWLQEAVEKAGAKMTGGGCGMGQADIDVELEGHRFNINIKPILR